MSDKKRNSVSDRKSVSAESKIDWKENAKDWRMKYANCDQQFEFFLLKNSDVARDDCHELLMQFKKFDQTNSGEIEVLDIKKILEQRKMAKSPQELKMMVDAIGDPDLTSAKKLTFLHFACAFFLKKWPSLYMNNADPADVEKFVSLRQEAEKNLGQWTAKLSNLQELEKKAMDVSLACNAAADEAVNGLAAVNATISQYAKDDAKLAEALEEEKKAKLAKGKAGAFEAQGVKVDAEKEKEKIKRDAKIKTEKKKAQQVVTDTANKSKQAKEEAGKAKEERQAAEVEVAKYTAEVMSYTEKQAACEKARAELENYTQLKMKYEVDSKNKAENDAKHKV